MDRSDNDSRTFLNPRIVALALTVLLIAIGFARAVVIARSTPGPSDERPARPFRGFSLDFMARLYDPFVGLLGMRRGFRLRTVELAGFRPGERVLDVGCATGDLTLYEKDAVGPTGYVAGIDIGPTLIHLAMEKSRKSGRQVDFEIASIEALPYRDASFDVVTISLTMHHLPTEAKRTGLAEVFRVLKPGGRLLIVDFGPTSPFFNAIVRILARVFFFIPEFSLIQDILEERIPQLVHEAGFSEVRDVGKHAFHGLPLQAILARKP